MVRDCVSANEGWTSKKLDGAPCMSMKVDKKASKVGRRYQAWS